MSPVRRLRAGLAALAVIQGAIGAVQLWAPRPYYDDFPWPAPPWVSAYPPYNEHLVRDVGALTSALALLLALAAVRPQRELVLGALGANLVAALPHLGLHLADHGHLTGASLVAELTALALGVIAPAALLVVAWRHGRVGSAPPAPRS